jgi:replicative DNA helicase
MFCGGCDPMIAEASINQFKTDLRNVYIVPTKVGLNEIPEYLRVIEEAAGGRVGVVGIDYLGLLDSEGENEYQQISSIAKGLKRLAKAINLPVVVLSQVSRKGGDGEIEISLDMGRGSGQIEEGADFVLGLWQLEKPEIEGPGYDLICRILKNRKGPKGKRFILDLDPPTLRFSGEAVEYTPPKTKKRRKCEP